MSKGHKRPAPQDDYGRAMSEFQLAFWADPTRAQRIRSAYAVGWAEYRHAARYDALLERLRDAARRRRNARKGGST